MDDWDVLRCPFPECGQDLYLRYDNSFGLSGWYYNHVEAPALGDIDCSTWKVECIEGHVILVPGPIDLDDENPEVVESDESRIFTSKDMLRLINVLNLDWNKLYG